METDWVCLDCELMPWSAKAQELIRQQYAATGAAAQAALGATVAVLNRRTRTASQSANCSPTPKRGCDMVGAYRDAYRRYCWPVTSLDDLKLAPFHLLATEDAVHVDKDHAWHLRDAWRDLPGR